MKRRLYVVTITAAACFLFPIFVFQATLVPSSYLCFICFAYNVHNEGMPLSKSGNVHISIAMCASLFFYTDTNFIVVAVIKLWASLR
jgi:hypothetical protein